MALQLKRNTGLHNWMLQAASKSFLTPRSDRCDNSGRRCYQNRESRSPHGCGHSLSYELADHSTELFPMGHVNYSEPEPNGAGLILKEQNMTELSGKVIIVTGAGQGIGLGVATYLAEKGATTVIAEFNADTAAAAQSKLTGEGLDVLGLECDVTKRPDVDKVVAKAIERYGRIDGVVNNAQWTSPGVPFIEQDEDSLRHSMESGAFGTVRFMQAVYPHMKRQGGGSIVNVTSATALQGIFPRAGYVASKGAVMSLTRIAAREWGPDNIRVNAYGPYAMTAALEMWANTQPEAFEELKKQSALGYIGDAAKDIAPAVAFLLGDESHYMTGQVFMVDGGQYVSPV